MRGWENQVFGPILGEIGRNPPGKSSLDLSPGLRILISSPEAIGADERAGYGRGLEIAQTGKSLFIFWGARAGQGGPLAG